MLNAVNIARVVASRVLKSSNKPAPTAFDTVQKVKLNEPFVNEPVIPEEFLESIDLKIKTDTNGELSDEAAAKYFESHFKWLGYKELLNRKAARLHRHSDAWLVGIVQGSCSLTSDDRSTWERLADVIKRFAGFRI